MVASAMPVAPPPAAAPPRGGRGSPASTARTPEERHERFSQKLVLAPGERGRPRKSWEVDREKGREGAVGVAAGPEPGAKLTPLEQQVVACQRKHPGILLLFEVGYKYRMFGDDADVGSKALNIMCYRDRNFLTCSVPTHRIQIYLRRLVQAGHKVGVVAQQETAALKHQGTNRSAPFTRALGAVYTRATIGAAADLAAVASGAPGGTAGAFASEDLTSFVVVVTEGPSSGTSSGGTECAYCAVDCSTGRMVYDFFQHDAMRSRLELCLLCLPPTEILLADNLRKDTKKLLQTFGSQQGGVDGSVRMEEIKSAAYDGTGARTALMGRIQACGADDEGSQMGAALERLPDLLVCGLAHCMDYLGQFELDGCVSLLASNLKPFRDACEMHLSPNTVRQLEILRNNDDGKEKGSLFWLLNRAQTPAGARLLRSWVCHPLQEARAIDQRLDAVEALLGTHADLADVIRLALGKLPDAERRLARVLHKTATPEEFMQLVKALLLASEILEPSVAAETDGVGGGSSLTPILRECLERVTDVGLVQECHRQMGVLDAESAAKNDKLHLFASSERFPKVAALQGNVAGVRAELQGYLDVLRKELRKPSLKYVSIQNQGDWLVELPVTFKGVPRDWAKVCGTKQVNRFMPPTVRGLKERLEVHQELLLIECNKTWKRFLGDMEQHYLAFSQAVQALASLDALIALASVSSSTGYTRPRFLSSGSRISIEGGRHPVLDAVLERGAVPNNTGLDVEKQKAAVVMGPNMGGKSVYVKQVALLSIMAQVGCFVPASKMELSPLDAVWTRMGADDSLSRGQSTFQVELGEASLMMRASTPRTLLIMDELGRGTSTHDGVAIAVETLKWLVQSQAKGLLLFVTHFPEVGALASGDELRGRIGAYHMGFINSNSQPGSGIDTADASDRVPKVTFLYKVQSGACDRSFGLNVARMAGVPEGVVKRSSRLSREFEAGGSRAQQTQKRLKLCLSAEALAKELRGGLAGVAFTGALEADVQSQARARELLQRLQT